MHACMQPLVPTCHSLCPHFLSPTFLTQIVYAGRFLMTRLEMLLGALWGGRVKGGSFFFLLISHEHGATTGSAAACVHGCRCGRHTRQYRIVRSFKLAHAPTPTLASALPRSHSENCTEPLPACTLWQCLSARDSPAKNEQTNNLLAERQ
jgi:hypothetical protein